MIASSTLSLSNVPQPPLPATGPPLSEPKSSPSTPTSEPPSPPKSPAQRIKTSPQLNRWSRARAIRSGRKLSRQPNGEINNSDSQFRVIVDNNDGNGSDLQPLSPSSEGAIDGDFLTDVTAGAGVKAIYMVSDGTGWTVEHSVTAALGQFEHCLVDRACSVNTHLFSGVDEVDRLMEIVAQAAKEGAMVVYTLADPSFAESARKACRLWGVTSLDVLSPITESIASL
ncbi:hypothetical protein CASFOL_040665 [Castilleja foliolosa]|uniref:Uncharacterized protein n=1 Tax=Castilleja foliolosa TaxID=1961234 RepID=A0ABD3BCW6_9LAMI